ncbi:MAG: response regulator [Oscillatoria sp. PMC 1068.18]|nr:response regulator [Oscillatoria sp. PMC 1076.18]MEC4988257.1 response regulator [Oscillatoria sp. PMC 1068.18]
MLIGYKQSFGEIKNYPDKNLVGNAQNGATQIKIWIDYELPSKQILLVNAENDLQEVIKTGLELTTNWKILTSDRAHHSLSLAKEQQPNAILINIEKKDLTEINFWLQLRQKQEWQQIPVILLVDRLRRSDKKRLKKLEIAGAIAKPFDMVNLGKQIASFLQWNLA